MKKFLLIIVIVVFFTGCSANTKNSDYLKNGRANLDRYEYTLALKEFEAGRAQDPTNEEYYLAIADVYLKKGNYPEVEKVLNEGHNKTDSIKISNALGELYLDRGNFEESARWFDTALLKDPKYVESMKGKIKLLALKNEAKSFSDYFETIDTDIYDSELYLMKAVLNIQETEESSKLILQSIATDDDNREFATEFRLAVFSYEKAQSVHNLSQIIYVLLNYGWYEMAQLPVTKVIEENQFYETGYIYQGLIYLHTNQLESAKEMFAKVKDLNPNNTDAKIFLTQTYFLTGDKESALALINEIIQNEDISIDPQQYGTIQDILFENHEYELIEALYTGFSETTTISASNLLTYIEVLIKTEKYNQAEILIEKLDNQSEKITSSEQARLKTFLAVAKYNSNRKQEGLDLISAAESIDNTIPVLHYYKGVILKDNGSLEEAKTSLERAIELDLQGDVTDIAGKLLTEF